MDDFRISRLYNGTASLFVSFYLFIFSERSLLSYARKKKSLTSTKRELVLPERRGHSTILDSFWQPNRIAPRGRRYFVVLPVQSTVMYDMNNTAGKFKDFWRTLKAARHYCTNWQFGSDWHVWEPMLQV